LYLDYGAFAHVIGKVRNFNNVKRMVDSTSVKLVVGCTHKVYGKGNVVVAYQGGIKTMNNVIYAFKKKSLVSKGYCKHRVCYDV
jgi:hypothetical protein